MQHKQVTIIIPNYKTYDLTKICLRLIRKNTDLSKAHIIVVDNNSNDESTKYLKKLTWIEFIHRDGVPNESGPMSHARALDLGLKRAKTPYVAVIHTDTFILHPGWLNYILKLFKDKSVGGVGSWKLEHKNLIKKIGKKIEYIIKKLFKVKISKERFNKEYHYLRSHCAFYRTKYIKLVKSSFSDRNESPGKVLHEKLKKAGYKMIFLESNQLLNYVDHVNHATLAINRMKKKKADKKALKKIMNFYKRKDVIDVIDDDSLDN
jgi:glycosyltransferase involved in cell wall biosynthesis